MLICYKYTKTLHWILLIIMTLVTIISVFFFMHCLFDILGAKTVVLFFNLWIPLRNHLVKHSYKVFSSVSQSVVSNSLRPHGLKHSSLPCPSPNPGACLNSRPSGRWCHSPTWPSVVSFSSCLQSFPASGSFPMSQFTSGGQSVEVSASATF